MPPFPDVAPSVAAMSGAVYSALAHRLAQRQGEVYPLHVGDTWMEAPEGCRMEDLRAAEYPGLARYAPVTGLPALVDALLERTRARTGTPTERRDVLVAAGGTGALGAVVGALVSPGDEVLVLAPHWPLIAGIVRSFHAAPIAVPFFGVARDAASAVALVEAAATPRAVALYVSTPNNPTGRVLPREWLEALVAWARRRGLWVLSDEVYEDHQFEGVHAPARPLAPERVFSVHSASKAYGMAGNRCGWVVGPGEVMDHVRKVSTHTFYSTPTASQVALLRALAGPGDAWAARARALYADVGRRAAERLGLPAPLGSTFLFLDVAPWLDARGLGGLLEDCVGRGLLVAPGPSFGPYPTHVRLCYTAAEPAVVLRGVEALAGLIGR